MPVVAMTIGLIYNIRMKRLAPNYCGLGAHYISGIKPVIELIMARPQQIECVFYRATLCPMTARKLHSLCEKKQIPLKLVDEACLDSLCHVGEKNHISHQGVVARIGMPNIKSITDLLHSARYARLPVVVALDQIKDPGNLGTLCRTIHALGGAGIVVPKHNSAFLGPAAQRAAAGALAYLPVAHVTNLAHALDEAEENDFHVYGASSDSKKTDRINIVDAFRCMMEFPAVIVLGSEEKGIRPNVAKRCGEFIHIPMSNNFDSINVAQAGAILLALAVKSYLYERCLNK